MIERALRHPARRVACTAVRHVLYAVESEAMTLPVRLERHRQACLGCQAEAARQRRIVRALADMATQVESAPHDLAAAMRPDDHVSIDTVEATRNQVATRTALAASLAALGIAVALRKRAS